LTAPERVRALVLCCTMAGIAHAPAVQAFLAAREKMGAEGPARLALSDAFEMRAPEAAYLYRQITAFNPPLDPSAGQVLFSPEVLIPPAALGAVRAPVLLLNGALDPIWPPASVADLPAHFPDARQLVLPDTGHSPYFEAPAAFNAAITAFLDQTASK
jgi:3-oxoadipate enol-lactonase